jgi:hypothetical protein
VLGAVPTIPYMFPSASPPGPCCLTRRDEPFQTRLQMGLGLFWDPQALVVAESILCHLYIVAQHLSALLAAIPSHDVSSHRTDHHLELSRETLVCAERQATVRTMRVPCRALSAPSIPSPLAPLHCSCLFFHCLYLSRDTRYIGPKPAEVKAADLDLPIEVTVL